MDDRPSSPKLIVCRAMGIDYGMARIGIAISDASKIIAMPLLTLQAEKRLELTVNKVVQEIRKQEEQHKCCIDEIAVGLPLRMNGTVGMMADEVKLFIALLQKQLTCTIIPWDERLSTVQAERTLRESGMTRKKRSQVIDKVTAVIILDSYLSFKQHQKWMNDDTNSPNS
jgi:putative Holliday junction resolvase